MPSSTDLRRLVEEITDRTGFTRLMGVRVAQVEAGRVSMSLPRTPDLLQFHGSFHGGAIAALADQAAGAAATTVLPAGQIAITVDLHLAYLAPARGEALLAEAIAVHTGSTLCVAAIDVRSIGQGRAELAARGTATLRIVRAPTPGGEPAAPAQPDGMA